MSGSDLGETIRTLTIHRPARIVRPRMVAQVTSGPEAGAQHTFDGRLRVGSSAVADLRLSDARVSGLHCEIQAERELRVRDLGSKNVTYLGSHRIVEAFLQPGDTLQIGETRFSCRPLGDQVEVPLSERTSFHGLVGQSAVMRALVAQLECLAPTDTTVLLLGETGCGKERVAEALHLAGPRATRALVIVDCGALPGSLIEDELFGHERGAYTGAERAVEGAFERAHGGTLFLDEVGELPLELQPKLLRALASRRVRRLGGSRTRTVDVRVVAATNRDLAADVTRGRFREDLYYRLAVVTLHLPALRERREDVPLLAVRFLEELGVDPASCLDAESLSELMEHDWPGNVRELRNTLERAAALMQPVSIDGPGWSRTAAGELRGLDLDIPLPALKQRLSDQLERDYVKALHRACNGNVSEVARRAGLSRMTVYRVLARHGLAESDP